MIIIIIINKDLINTAGLFAINSSFWSSVRKFHLNAFFKLIIIIIINLCKLLNLIITFFLKLYAISLIIVIIAISIIIITTTVITNLYFVILINLAKKFQKAANNPGRE